MSVSSISGAGSSAWQQYMQKLQSQQNSPADPAAAGAVKGHHGHHHGGGLKQAATTADPFALLDTNSSSDPSKTSSLLDISV